MLPLPQSGSSDQWFVLMLFFAVFMLAGLFNKPKARQLTTTHFHVFGVLIILANSGLLWLLNNNGFGHFDIFNALALKNITLESCFIVFGYCLIFRGLGQWIRGMFVPSRHPNRID